MEAARNEPLPSLKIATLLQEDLVVVPLTTRSVPAIKMVIASLYNSDIKHSFTMAGYHAGLISKSFRNVSRQF